MIRAMVERCLEQAIYLNHHSISESMRTLVILHQWHAKDWLLAQLASTHFFFKDIKLICSGLNGPRDYERSRNLMKMLEECYINIFPKVKRSRDQDYSFTLGRFKEAKLAIDRVQEFSEILQSLNYAPATTQFLPNDNESQVSRNKPTHTSKLCIAVIVIFAFHSGAQN